MSTSSNIGRAAIMIRISLPWVFGVVTAIDQLDRVQAAANWANGAPQIYNAKMQLEALFDQSIYREYLRISRQKASELHVVLSSFVEKINREANEEITPVDIWTMLSRRDEFRTVFFSELSTLPSFLVTAKEGYDINLLIDRGMALFPESLLTKAPETEKDAMQAGKALAYELATACGFHTFRITESVIKRYWDVVSDGKERPHLETIGNYSAEMEKQKFGDQKIVESLKQMSRLHRNPLIHPEVILTGEEAIEILGIARSVIGAMLRVLPDEPPTTGAPSDLPPS